MPIKGLTDIVIPQFPTIGKLRKGGEKTDNKPGAELTYWRFTSDNPEVEAAFYAAYPSQPTSVQVYIPHATPEEAFPNWCEIWKAGGLVHRCDGETMFIWLEGDKYKRGNKPCDGGHKDNDPQNDSVGRLQVVIPQLWQAGHIGYVTAETHGKNDILSISRSLEAVYQSCKGNGNPNGLMGIRFNLKRVPESISVPGFGKNAGKRSKTIKYNVKIEPEPEWASLQIEAAAKSQMLLADTVDGDVKQLPAPEPVIIEPEPQPEPEPFDDDDIPDFDPSTPDPGEDQEFDAIGERLWFHSWDTFKKVILDTVGNDYQSALQVVKNRETDIKNNKIESHIKKAFPGMEVHIEELKKAAGSAWNPIYAVAGLAKAHRVSLANTGNALTQNQIVNIAMTEFPEPF